MGHIDMMKIGNVMNKITELWKKYPQLRLGQLIANTGIEEMLYYISDDDLVKLLYNFYDNLEKENNK